MSEAPFHKWCNFCEQFLPSTSFVKDARSPDGLLYRCKECEKAGRKAAKANKGKGGYCKWCNRRVTLLKEGYCTNACRKVREKMLRKYPERPVKEGVDPDGYIYFIAGFFDELRLKLGESDTDALAFVTRREGQYQEWCELLSVPSVEALTAHLLAQWGVPYLSYDRVVKPPEPPPVVQGRADALCADCGETDGEMFNRRGNGYRSYCKACDARRLREHRARRKMGVVR